MKNPKLFKKGEKKSAMDAFKKMDDKQMNKVAGGAAAASTGSAPAQTPVLLQALVHNEE